LGANFEVTVGRAAWRCCSAPRMFGSCSILARGTKNVTEKLDRVGRSQDIPDARWHPASSPPFKHQIGNGGLHKFICCTTSKLQILYLCFFRRVTKFHL